MNAIKVQNKTFKSLRSACAYFDVSYQKAIRLCRKYERANLDPSISICWLLGIERLDYRTEKKHFKYYRDIELSKLRVLDKRARDSIRFKKEIIKSVF